jgi:hypothetical protein
VELIGLLSSLGTLRVGNRRRPIEAPELAAATTSAATSATTASPSASISGAATTRQHLESGEWCSREDRRARQGKGKGQLFGKRCACGAGMLLYRLFYGLGAGPGAMGSGAEHQANENCQQQKDHKIPNRAPSLCANTSTNQPDHDRYCENCQNGEAIPGQQVGCRTEAQGHQPGMNGFEPGKNPLAKILIPDHAARAEAKWFQLGRQHNPFALDDQSKRCGASTLFPVPVP